MSEMHECAVPECTRRCSVEYLMCRPDWWRVTPTTRDWVYQTYFSGSAEYVYAREAAITEALLSRRRAAERAGL